MLSFAADIAIFWEIFQHYPGQCGNSVHILPYKPNNESSFISHCCENNAIILTVISDLTLAAWQWQNLEGSCYFSSVLLTVWDVRLESELIKQILSGKNFLCPFKHTHPKVNLWPTVLNWKSCLRVKLNFLVTSFPYQQ